MFIESLCGEQIFGEVVYLCMVNYKSTTYTLTGASNKKFLADVSLPEGNGPFPLVVFSHGFKGFKDWGFNTYLPEYFASRGFAFIKFNFSHNGVNIDKSDFFDDLDAFGENNFTKELFDLGVVIDFALTGELKNKFKSNQLYLLGHSMGGGVSILKASQDKRVSKVAVWATVSNFFGMFNRFDMDQWRKTGLVYIENARTKQQMPLHYQLYIDSIENRESLDILTAAGELEVPLLMIHGDNDESVNISHSKEIYENCLHSILVEIPGASHTFGCSHPFNNSAIPSDFKEVLENTVEFFED